MNGRWTVRQANAADAPAVGALAAAAWRDTYAGLLKPETIEAFVANAYSPDRLASRINADHFFVAEDEAGIAAFADTVDRADRFDLVAIYALPERRSEGAGSALLNTLIDLAAGRDISADVLAGNRKGEIFYERRGFAPRERLEADLFGEHIVERRWWRPSSAGS